MKRLAVFSAVFALATAAQAAPWNTKTNNPHFFGIIVGTKTLNSDFNALPMKAALKDDRLGWSETFWPSNKGGIAFRWNSKNPQPFKYNMYSKKELMRMSEEELSELSPAELYDIAMGDYRYSLTKKVLKTYNLQDYWWEGICHGWALAAVNYPEPDKNVVTNKDGIQVPFGASDVKALLAMHDAYNSKGFYASIGTRCDVEGKVPGEAFPEDGDKPMPSAADANIPKCEDTNAGAFHIVLTNMIGIHSKGFVADVDRFNDVWNQPVVSYESEMMGEEMLSSYDQKNGVARKVRVKTKMTYGDELEFYSEEEAHKGTLGFVSKEPVTGTPMQTWGTKNYEYVLELDFRGNIIGGSWISESRPDFIWTKTKDKEFTGNPGNGTAGFGKLFRTHYPLQNLGKIYKPVQR